jgi:cyclopropane-fatty-acyl-phospholipid synthase
MDIKSLVIAACSAPQEDAFEVEFWDGDRHKFGQGPAAFAVILKSAEMFGELFTKDPDILFGEAYMDGRLEIEGDIQRLVRIVQRQSLDQFRSFLAGDAGPQEPDDHSPEMSRRDVSHHYDLGNDFFSLWLGKTMAYSCAYFKSRGEDLDTAQERKFEYICRKLQLKSGELLLDIGCGWGGLLVHAARAHGARGLGITLSEEQKAFAEERVRAAGLSDLVRIEYADYRELPAGERFDKISSVGMVEHVGKSEIPSYVAHTARLLKEGGLGFIQTMGHLAEAQTYHWVKKYIFPGHYLPRLDELALELGRADLEVIDVENLRVHYGLTVDRWIKAYEAVAERVKRERGERFFRMWRFYLHSLAGGFKYGEMKLWQITFTKGLVNDRPLTRDHLYNAAL